MTLPAARVSDMHTCPMFTALVPHVGGPILPPGAPITMTGGPFQARLSDMATCAGPPDVIAMGAATVLVQGLPAARQTDMTAHGGLITVGLPTVLIGGPAFALPPNIKINGPPVFQQKVYRDMFLLSTTPSGQALINQLGASGKPVTIVQNTGVNGFCTPINGTDAQNGTGTGSTIQYNPDYHTAVYDSAGNMIAEPPQVILAHEMCHALANSSGTQQSTAPNSDPNPPASQTNIEREESQAIGTGSHNGQNPSENSVRNDLGLPRRDNHYLNDNPGPGAPAQQNLRPGDPPL